MITTPDTWVDVAGFDYEKLHTNVLSTLLTSPKTREITAAWLGEQSGVELPAGDLDPLPEGRPHATKHTKTDLLIPLPADRQLVIETKVASRWKTDQLDRQLCCGHAECRGVLFGLGAQFLTLHTEDLAEMRVAERLTGHWSLIDLEAWCAHLSDIPADALPSWFDEYRKAIRARTWHLSSLRAGVPVDDVGSTSTDAHWAYFAAVLDELDSNSLARRYQWRSLPLVSGPVLDWGLTSDPGTRFLIANTNDGVEAEVFINLVAEGDARRLLVRCGIWSEDTDRRPADVMGPISDAIDEHVSAPASTMARQGAARARSRTIRRYDLDPGDPLAAAQITRSVVAGLISMREAGLLRG